MDMALDVMQAISVPLTPRWVKIKVQILREARCVTCV